MVDAALTLCMAAMFAFAALFFWFLHVRYERPDATRRGERGPTLSAVYSGVFFFSAMIFAALPFVV